MELQSAAVQLAQEVDIVDFAVHVHVFNQRQVADQIPRLVRNQPVRHQKTQHGGQRHPATQPVAIAPRRTWPYHFCSVRAGGRPSP